MECVVSSEDVDVGEMKDCSYEWRERDVQKLKKRFEEDGYLLLRGFVSVSIYLLYCILNC